MPSILFICRHNACRSQIAEAICRKLTLNSWVIVSAGSNPTDQVDSKATEIIRSHQLVMSSTKPKGFSALPAVRWDYVVSMDPSNNLPSLPTQKLIKWDIPDPQDGPMHLYEELFEDLTRRIRQLIQEIERASP